MKVQVAASELTNLSVDKVSLVKRGANREPFTLIKSEDEVNDGTLIYKAADKPKDTTETKKDGTTLGRAVKKLGEFFSGKPADKPVTVSAVFVKEDVAEHYTPLLKEQGFDVENTEVNDGVTVFKQEGYDSENEGTVIKLDDNVAVAASEVIKYFSTYSYSSNFGEALQANLFWPGIYAATRTIEEVLWSILDDAEDAKDASSGIDSALEEFTSYIKGVTGSLPSTMFKLDNMVQEQVKKGDLLKGAERSKVAPDKSEITKSEEEEMTVEVFEGTRTRKVDGELVEATYTYEKAEDGTEIFLDWGEVEKKEPKPAEPATKTDDDDAPAWAEGLIKTVGSLNDKVEALEKSDEERKELAKGTVITKQTGSSEDAFDELIKNADDEDEEKLWKTEKAWLSGGNLFDVS